MFGSKGWSFLVLAAIAAAPASAQDGGEAELRRLRGEIDKLSAKNAWGGVERHYQAMEKLGVALSVEDHLAGAQAARALGDITRSRERVIRALTLREDPEALAWLADIDAQYGRVALLGVAGTHQLEVVEMPFTPDQAAAVTFAQGVVASTGSFEGLLPKGDYRFGPFEVDVLPRVQEVRVDLRADSGRARAPKPAPTPKPEPAPKAPAEPKPAPAPKPAAGPKPPPREAPLDAEGSLEGADDRAPLVGAALGAGHVYGIAGVLLSVRPTPKQAISVGVGVDAIATLSPAFSLSARQRLGETQVFYVDGQFGPLGHVRPTATEPAKVLYGPSAGGGIELTKSTLLVDVQLGLGLAPHPTTGWTPYPRLGLGIGANFEPRK